MKRTLGTISVLLALTLLVLAIVACGGRVGLGSLTEGTFTRGSFTNEHGTRDYRLYVPSDYDEEEGGVPLIVMLHGCRLDAEDFAAGTQMNVFAEREGFLVLYPEQRLDANLLNCWNWFEPSNQERGSGEDYFAISHLTKPSRFHYIGLR